MKGKNKVVLAVIASVLSVALLAGGIVSAVLFPEKIEETATKTDVEVVKSKVKLEELAGGGF